MHTFARALYRLHDPPSTCAHINAVLLTPADHLSYPPKPQKNADKMTR